MNPTYIVGYEAQRAAPRRAALRFATVMAGAAGGDVIVARVYPWTMRSYAKGAGDGPVAALDEQARAEASQMLTAEGVPEAMQHVMGGGSPAEGLQRLIESRKTALLAVGTTHRGSLGRMVPGSVAEHLLHGAPCPVAVVPADAAAGPIRTVAVAYDDSREAHAALQAGAALARRLDARLRIIGVSQTGRSFASPAGVPYLVEEPIGDVEARLDRRLTSVADALPSDMHVEVSSRRRLRRDGSRDQCPDRVGERVDGVPVGVVDVDARVRR